MRNKDLFCGEIMQLKTGANPSILLTRRTAGVNKHENVFLLAIVLIWNMIFFYETKSLILKLEPRGLLVFSYTSFSKLSSSNLIIYKKGQIKEPNSKSCDVLLNLIKCVINISCGNVPFSSLQ